MKKNFVLPDGLLMVRSVDNMFNDWKAGDIVVGNSNTTIMIYLRKLLQCYKIGTIHRIMVYRINSDGFLQRGKSHWIYMEDNVIYEAMNEYNKEWKKK